MKFPKIVVTHDNTFHADEISAIALLQVVAFKNGLPCPKVEHRVHAGLISEEEFENPEIWVLDMGRRANSKLGLYDHHQNPNLPATNVLVLKDMAHMGLIDRQEGKKLLVEVFRPISKVDIGEVKESGVSDTPSGIVRGLNGLEGGREDAISYMRILVERYMYNEHHGQEAQHVTELRSLKNQIKMRKESAAIWGSYEKFKGYAIDQEGIFCAAWMEIAEQEGIKFLVTPNSRGGWQITSRDSALFNIPVMEGQTFRHNSGFLAVWETKEEALSAVEELTK